MAYLTPIDPGKEIPDDMAEETVLSGDGVNPVNLDPERSWGKHDVSYDGFHLDFPGVIPPAYFPGYPGSGSGYSYNDWPY